MVHTTEANTQTRPHRRAGRWAPALILLAAVAACDGDNLFEGDSAELLPRVVDIVVPQAVLATDTVRIRVDAAAARRVAQVLISVRGAVQRDTAIDVEDQRQQVSVIFPVAIPLVIQDSLLRVSAQVADAAGALSAAQEVSTLAFGPPVVTSVSGPSGVRGGETINLRVSAFSARKVSRIDLSTRGAFTLDTSVAVLPPSSSATEIISVQLPDVVQDTIMTVTATAQDELGFSSPPLATLVPFAIDTPSVQVLVPPSVEAGKVLNVAVLASALRHVQQLRVEYRGGFTRDDVININPTRARTLEYISTPLPEDLAVPEVRVRVFALDRANTLSATPVHTVATPSGGPQIVALTPYQSTVTAGHLADVRVQAIGDRPIRTIRFRWRGFPADSVQDGNVPGTLVGPDQVLNWDPATTSVLEDVAARVPCVTTNAVFMVLATAYDVDDNLSPIVSAFINVTGDPACVPPPPPDTTGGSPRPAQRLPAGIMKDSGPLSFNVDLPTLRPGQSEALSFREYAALVTRRSVGRG